MEPIILLVFLSSVGLVLGLFLIIWIHSRTQLQINVPPREISQDHSTPLISIIVPARNEEQNIRRCVEQLLDQTYPNYELIVVDDRSTDATPEILKQIQERPQSGQTADRPRMLVIRGQDLRPGWAGKPYALFQGAEGARGEWLCFIDADTFASPRLIASTYLAAQEHQADMFSILTDQILGSFWEKVVIPVVFTGLSFGFPANQVNDPDQSNAIANGQFILIKRSIYESVGGHQAVKSRIDEDKAIAEVVKGAGYRLVLADGRALARTRMYTNFSELWEGWTKNIFLGMQGRFGLLLFGGVLGLIAALGLLAWFLAGVIWWVRTGGWPAALVALEIVVLLGVLLWVRAMAARAFHISPWYAFSLPLGALVFTAMMFASALKVLTGVGVTWKGRRYTNVKRDS